VSALKVCPQCGAEYELDQRFCPKDGSTLKTQGGEGDLVGSIIADRYHVLRKLGEGGMGQVYLAEHVKMGRKSAVKVMNPGMVHDADAISRFNREAANASRISHPNVAAVYDFGETGDGLIYLAMEFIEGPSLTKVIEQTGALPPQRAADITRQAGEALTVAHDMGIVHRDLKPDNIMIAKNRDGTDLVKVVDFGIAKAANNEAQKVTKTGLVVGTPEYMSPEQLAGDKLDGRSDIYSLALVTFNMLTGKLPFPSDSAQEAMIMRLTDKPKTLAEMNPAVAWPADVQAVMDRALEREAGRRYQAANDFGRALYAAVQAMPQSAAADMGTQVIGSAAAALPATRVAGGGDKAAAASTPAGKSKVPVFSGIAAAVVLVGAGGWYVAHGSSRAPKTTVASTDTVTGRSEAGTKTVGGRGSQGAQPRTVPPPSRGKENGAPVAMSTAQFDAELRRLRPLVDDSARAPDALNDLQKLMTASASSDQLARINLYMAYAKGTLGDEPGACSFARRGYATATDTTIRKQLKVLVDSDGCDKP
jgi:eukaryotic-like serine/threonine-protein kinase